MSDVPLAKLDLKLAKPLATRVPSPLPRAKPLSSTTSPISAVSKFPTLTVVDRPHVVIRVEPNLPDHRRRRTFAVRGLMAMAVCMAHVVVQEAPAWALSMVVHMVTLVTMAMVVVPEPVAYKAQHLVVAPPEENTIEEVMEISEQAAGDSGRRTG